jgi:hypothetical protein
MHYSQEEFREMCTLIAGETAYPLLGDHGTKAMAEHDVKLVELVRRHEEARTALQDYLVAKRDVAAG